jgi:hypothetical protein
MNLKPMFIELGREAAATGLPIMRPMILEYPGDPRFLAEDSQYMLGPDLLVAPIFEEGAAKRIVKFPAGRWRHLLSPRIHEGPADIEIACGLVDDPGVRARGRAAEGAVGPRRGAGDMVSRRAGPGPSIWPRVAINDLAREK